MLNYYDQEYCPGSRLPFLGMSEGLRVGGDGRGKHPPGAQPPLKKKAPNHRPVGTPPVGSKAGTINLGRGEHFDHGGELLVRRMADHTTLTLMICR
jgi:hypothetical protein